MEKKSSDIQRIAAYFWQPKSSIAILLVSVLASVTLWQMPLARASAVSGYERVVFFFAPSAERAYTYGSRYFDATHADEYDIGRAEYFFAKAAQREPTYPYIQHQLARVAFLRGDFTVALSHIDREVELYGSEHQNSYYVRGLIEGFMGNYELAALDYQRYIQTDPTNWAATNDLAWVLLKANRPKDALSAIEKVLPLWPENPWLLNSKATALFEMGRLQEARDAARAATHAVMRVGEADWLRAYPGNDPLIAMQGIAAFQSAVRENMHTISLALEKEQKNVR